MRTAVSRPTGRTGRLVATAMLVVLPLAATTACSDDSSPVDDEIEQEVEEETED